jgi:hypothetical protein
LRRSHQGLVPEWVEEGRRRAEAARLPFSDLCVLLVEGNHLRLVLAQSGDLGLVLDDRAAA